MTEQQIAKLKLLTHDILLTSIAGVLAQHQPALAADIALELQRAKDQRLPLLQLGKYHQPAVEEIDRLTALLTAKTAANS